MNNFQKIIDLVKKTGDKFIVVENNEPAYVITSFSEYEKLVQSNTGKFLKSTASNNSKPNITTVVPDASPKIAKPNLSNRDESTDEEKLLEKVNRDIADYRARQGDTDKKEDHYYIEPVENV